MESLICLFPGNFTLDKDFLPTVLKIKEFMLKSTELMDFRIYEKNNVQLGLEKLKTLDDPNEFNTFMKVYMNLILPMRETGYVELYKKIIPLFKPGIDKKLIVDTLERIREFLDILNKKYGSTSHFNPESDG